RVAREKRHLLAGLDVGPSTHGNRRTPPRRAHRRTAEGARDRAREARAPREARRPIRRARDREAGRIRAGRHYRRDRRQRRTPDRVRAHRLHRAEEAPRRSARARGPAEKGAADPRLRSPLTGRDGARSPGCARRPAPALRARERAPPRGLGRPWEARTRPAARRLALESDDRLVYLWSWLAPRDEGAARAPGLSLGDPRVVERRWGSQLAVTGDIRGERELEIGHATAYVPPNRRRSRWVSETVI